MQKTIGILIPTYQARDHLPHCLPFLLQSPLKPKILIIDSSSTDGTVEYAKAMGVETHVIQKKDFNHGRTREYGRHLLQTSIVVMITQDAYASSPLMLNYLVDPILRNEVSVTYARQLPHKQADIFARFARHFNYPPQSHQRGIEDLNRLGSLTFFCSNSCAAYCQEALNEIGGFPTVLFGEDTITVAKLLRHQHRIAYVAEAEVYHSHSYTLKEEFDRHYLMGRARQIYQELLAIGKNDSQRGKEFVKKLFKLLIKQAPLKIPYAFLQIVAKYSGYHIGRRASQKN